MKNYNNKGQAAMEFLMTYGWAILAAVIVIGALGTYFYFNSSTTTNFVVGAPFYGKAASASSSGVLSLEIENNGGETLNVTSVTVTGASSGGCTANTTSTSMAGGAVIFTLSGCTYTAGESYKGDVAITYLRPGSSLPLSSTGSLSLAAV